MMLINVGKYFLFIENHRSEKQTNYSAAGTKLRLSMATYVEYISFFPYSIQWIFADKIVYYALFKISYSVELRWICFDELFKMLLR